MIFSSEVDSRGRNQLRSKLKANCARKAVVNEKPSSLNELLTFFLLTRDEEALFLQKSVRMLNSQIERYRLQDQPLSYQNLLPKRSVLLAFHYQLFVVLDLVGVL